MSHTANLRNRYRPSQPETGNKRRRTDDLSQKVNGVTHQANGIIPHARITAQPTKTVKHSQHAPPAESSARITQPDADEDVEMADSESRGDDASSDDASSDDASSDDESKDEDEDENEDEDEDDEEGGAELASENEESDADEEDDTSTTRPIDHSTDPASTAAGTDEPTVPQTDDEPTFADLLKARGASPINVNVSEPTTTSIADGLTAQTSSRNLTAPTATSLGTVLTQALRTNDIDLLESCFQVPNLESIRATIERLHSSHATTLLQRLAERLHKRPGRAGSLMVWVQWTVVAHGGYLARQPAAMRELQTLHHVVKQRATGLQPLLALKGKLDMLEAQMQLRRNMQARTRARHPGAGEGVTYVEGQEESSSDEEGQRLPAVIGRTGTVSTDPRPKKGMARRKERPAKAPRMTEESESESEDEDVMDDMPSTMPDAADVDGFEDFGDQEDEDSEDEDSEDEEDDLIDDEAEETDQDSDALSDEVDYDDVDEASGSDEEEEEEEQRPKKRSKS